MAHGTVKCWRCEKRFPVSHVVRKVGDSVYVDKFDNVRDHWIAEHLKK